jgi:Ca-activated chloride channel family protein
MRTTTIPPARRLPALPPAAALLLALATQLLPGRPLAAQGHSRHPAHAHAWIAPGRGALGHGAPAVRVATVAAHARIVDRAATTTLELELHNPTHAQQEAVLLVPVPDGAAVSGFTFEGSAAEPTARLLARDEANRLYDEITAKLRDPALLEYAGLQCLRTSVFPVPARGTLRVRLTYDHVLDADGDRVDYVLPRSELLADDVPWSITVDLQARAPIAICHSSSHGLQTTHRSANARTLRVTERSRRDPGPFRLCFTTTADPARPTAAMFAYPDPSVGGGFFLLLANAPRPAAGAEPIRREVTLVLDRSGSMAGRKLEQGKAAVLQVLEGLAGGEGMQVIDYGTDVAQAFPRPVAKDARTLAAARAYVDAIRPHGGTNIHDALVEALRAPVMKGTLPLVLFLTDGLPTVGPSSEAELHRMVAAGNRDARRVFCFGVGHDVNVPLLDRIAEATRATATYVLPEDDVEVAVARTFARLGQPVLAAPKLFLANDPSARGRLRAVVPTELPDLFAGDQLVVLGQYRDGAMWSDELEWTLRGSTPAGDREYRFTLSLARASTANAFVPRLWASRQIAFLVDELRQREAPAGVALASGRAPRVADPRLAELRDEILRLSARYGVLGEYTAFLATEGSRLDDWNALASACQQALEGRAVATRSGLAAINQGNNLSAQKAQQCSNPRNVYFDAAMQRVEVDTVQQVCDRAFLKRGERWIDGNAVLRQRLEPDERVELGSPAWLRLRRRLEREHRAGVLSLPGEVLLDVDGRNVLVTPSSSIPAPTTEPNPTPKETIR